MYGEEFENALKKIGSQRIVQMIEILKEDPRALENFLEEIAEEALPDDPDDAQKDRFVTMLKTRFMPQKKAGGDGNPPSAEAGKN